MINRENPSHTHIRALLQFPLCLCNLFNFTSLQKLQVSMKNVLVWFWCFFGFGWLVGCFFFKQTKTMTDFLPSPIEQLRRKQWSGMALHLCRTWCLYSICTLTMTKQCDTQCPTDQTASKKESQAKSGAFSKQVTDLQQQVCYSLKALCTKKWTIFIKRCSASMYTPCQLAPTVVNILYAVFKIISKVGNK